MDFELRKEDILKIGHAKSEYPDVGTRFICNPITANIEKIFLRNIFNLFREEDNEDYMITDIFYNMGYPDSSQDTIEYITDFPYEKYERILFS